MTQNSEIDERVELAVSQSIATIKIYRAKKLNCLTAKMLDELVSHLDEVEENREIKVLVVAAAEGKAFCAGADINDWKTLSPIEMWQEWVTKGHRIFDRLARLRQPVICAVSGLALGGGLELAAAADVRLATRNAKFALPEASIATCPGWSGSQRLVREMGPGWVKAMALFGVWWSAEEALQSGFLQGVAEDYEQLQALVQEWVLKAESFAPISVQLNKQIINAANGDGVAVTLEGLASAVAASTSDAAEGKKSFRLKQKPNFKGL